MLDFDDEIVDENTRRVIVEIVTGIEAELEIVLAFGKVEWKAMSAMTRAANAADDEAIRPALRDERDLQCVVEATTLVAEVRIDRHRDHHAPRWEYE